MMVRYLQVISQLTKGPKLPVTWGDLASSLVHIVSKTFTKFLTFLFAEAKNDLEMGNKTSKMHAEEINQKNTDYNKSLDERIKDGAEVKHFMNKKRIEYGRMNDEVNKHR